MRTSALRTRPRMLPRSAGLVLPYLATIPRLKRRSRHEERSGWLPNYESKIKGNARFSRKPLSAHRILWRHPPLGWRQATHSPRPACRKRRKSGLFAAFPARSAWSIRPSRQRMSAKHRADRHSIRPPCLCHAGFGRRLPRAHRGPRFPSMHRTGPVRSRATRAAWHRCQTLVPDPKDMPCLRCPHPPRSPSASPKPAA